jgi:hypothetical protein
MKYSMKHRSRFITRGTLVGLAFGAMLLLDGAPAQAQTNWYWVLAGVTYPSAGCSYDSTGDLLLSQGSASSGSCNVVVNTPTSAWSYCGSTQPTTVDVGGGYFNAGPFHVITSGSAAWSAACTSVATATTNGYTSGGVSCGTITFSACSATNP